FAGHRGYTTFTSTTLFRSSVKGKTGTADFRLRPHVGKRRSDEWKFDEELWRRQVECISYLDARIGDLLDGLREDRQSITIALCRDRKSRRLNSSHQINSYH